ncbi:MAG: hypothetical protein IPI57_18800 [Candidatus Competibacteraceae bacterium]|nr:hypothetical protein [Candidatus Competibacteraceae bacterium]MBK7984948.1 hypothetical protein [Candidatus Competibacteraceae bacterium]
MKEAMAAVRGHLFKLKCRLAKKKVSIGTGLRIFCKLEIEGQGAVSIGNNCTIARINGDDRHYVTIYTHDPAAVISIGDDAMLFAARISSRFEIKIGNQFLIEEAGIMDTDFHTLTPDRAQPAETKEKCAIAIGDRVAIGARSVICKGVSLGDDVLVWPGSIVKKTIPSGVAVCGNPARAIK